MLSQLQNPSLKKVTWISLHAHRACNSHIVQLKQKAQNKQYAANFLLFYPFNSCIHLSTVADEYLYLTYAVR